MMRKYILYIFYLIIPLSFFGQMTIEKKADYILYISQKVTWPNQDKIKTFVIGVYNDKAIEEELKTMIKDRKFHNRPIKIVSLTGTSSLKDINMIYINKLNTNIDITDLVSLIKGKGILIISENYSFHKSMINFIEHKGLLRFEMNSALIQSEGFKVAPLFAAKAIKTESSWVNIYLETEKKLKKEHQIVEQQQVKIEEQKQQISIQEKRIEEQLNEIKIQENKINEQYDKLQNLQNNIEIKQKILEEKMKLLAMQKRDIVRQQEEIIKQNNILNKQKKDIRKQTHKIKEQKQKLNKQLAKIKMQNLIIYLGILVIVLIILATLFIYRSYKIKKKTNKILKQKNEEILFQNEQILQQKEEIEAQRDEIEAQKNIALAQRDEIALQKKEIIDSIHYAQRIQLAVLPPVKILENITKNNYFILNLPRDIVSGDYYWMINFNEYSIVSAADCTGHGVPGAFMSMLGISFLNEIMNDTINDSNHIPRANEILMKLRKKIIKSLHQTGAEGEQKDGIDMALYVINHKTNELQFSGANNPIYLIRNKPVPTFKTQINPHEFKYLYDGQEENRITYLEAHSHFLLEIKGDKMPIGIHTDPNDFFTNHIVELEPNDTLYIFSDGFADQFGGEKNKKFKYKPMKKLLLSIQDKTMSEQKEILLNTFIDWKRNYFQVDDVLIIGTRFQS
ncbi:MAG TPA: DUF4154 domain-containing protein [Bacteroidales bacterium]|nr:DUF4154 domain-containing protein [Bacteroidales bacterium]